jgi:hypothetical protein
MNSSRKDAIMKYRFETFPIRREVINVAERDKLTGLKISGKRKIVSSRTGPKIADDVRNYFQVVRRGIYSEN